MVENENGSQQPIEVVAIPTEAKADFMAKYGSSMQDVETTDDDEGDGSENPEGADKGDDKSNSNPAGNQKPDNNTDDNNNGNEDEPETPLAILAKQYGYDAKDEIFKDLDLEDDSIETITEFYNRREAVVQQSAINELFETIPEVKDLVTHLQQGGTVATWKEVKQAEEFNLDFAKEDIEGKTKFLMNVYKEKGLSEKAAKRAIEALIDDDELDSEVTANATKLKETMSAAAKAKADAELAQAKKDEEESIKVVNQVNNIVKTGKLSNAVIPDTERKSFNEFVLSPKLNEAYEALTLEQRLFIDYMVFKGFKVPGLVKTEAPKGEAKRVTIKSKGSDGGGNSSVGELTLEDLRKMSQRR